MFLHNNLKFDTGTQHVIDDVQYPRGWFLDAANRAALGVTEVPEPVRPDDNFFTTSENPDGSLTATPRAPEDIAARAANAVTNLQADIVGRTQQRLDVFAQTRGYDGILSACTYAASAVPNFTVEGQYAVAARDATWAALYTLMTDVQAGTAPMPTGFADIAPLLPALEWPL